MFEMKDTLTEREVRSGLRYLTLDGVMSQSMATLTAGAFLTAFAIQLGASNFVIGLLAAIGPLSQLLQLPGILLVEKVRNRRAITVFAALISRLCFLMVALLPFLVGPQVAVAALVVLLIVNSALGAIGGCSWNSWMRDFVPESIMGSYFSKRMRWATAAGIALSILGAGYLDLWKGRFPDHLTEGYCLLFVFGFVFGAMGVFCLNKVPETNMAAGEHEKIMTILSRPFRDENFRKLIAFMCSWNFAANLAGPFFMVYMLKRLGLSMSMIIGLSILSQVMNFLFLRLWGSYTDRFSNKSVLQICGPMMLVAIFGWTFTTMPETYFLTLPLLILIHILMGIASAGVSLANGNIALKLAPKGQATAYLAANTVANSVAAGIAPILGGKFADFFSARELTWTLTYKSPDEVFDLPTLSLQGWDFFFFLAAIIGLYSMHRLAMIREEGQVDEKIVMRELLGQVRSQVRTLTSIEGIRQMVSFPFAMLINFKDYIVQNGNGVSDKESGQNQES